MVPTHMIPLGKVRFHGNPPTLCIRCKKEAWWACNCMSGPEVVYRLDARGKWQPIPLGEEGKNGSGT